MDGKRVRLTGTTIERGGRKAIEVTSGSVTVIGATNGAPPGADVDLGLVTLRGEIVDGKCYLGVMNPGEGATHRDCAVQCIRGGLPPLFAVVADDGAVSVFTLASATGQPVNSEVADLVGRWVEISGRAFTRDNELLLFADPSRYRFLR